MVTSRKLRWTLVAPLALLGPVLLGAAAVAQTQETRLDGKVRAGDSVVVAADETIEHNLYVTGGQIRIDGRVEGDLVAAGGQVDVAGEIAGDALLAGGAVNLSGDVDGDVRVGAGQFSVSGAVGGDVLIASGQATVGSTAVIAEDLIFSTGQMVMNGAVSGGALGRSGDYRETGSIAGERDITVAEREPPTAADRVLNALRRYVSLLLVGALLLWLASRVIGGGAATLRGEPLKTLGVGALGVVGFIAIVIVLVIATVLLGIVLGLIQLGGLAVTAVFGGIFATAAVTFAFVIVAAYIAQILVGIWLGRFALGGQGGWARDFGALALGVLAVVLLSAVPVLGAIVRLLVLVLGLGALLLGIRRRRVQPRPEGPGPMPAEAAA